MSVQFNEWLLPRRTSNGMTCVAIKFTESTVSIRNHLRPDAGTAEFTHEEWKEFVAAAKDGVYDL